MNRYTVRNIGRTTLSCRLFVIKHDQPWEGSGSGFHSIFKDGDKYRMYYKAWQLTVG